ncbi:MAG: hypothetical protein R3285_10615 [Kiloniellales bacterium]|nr:hypothetical protein [Kiloniellales bacterium]
MNEDLERGRVPPRHSQAVARPTAAQAAYLRRGLAEPGGKLPLFDRNGQRYSSRTIQSCIDQGWATPWFHNPIKPDWLICRLTEAGQAVLAEIEPAPEDRPARRSRRGTDGDARRLQRLVKDRVEA